MGRTVCWYDWKHGEFRGYEYELLPLLLRCSNRFFRPIVALNDRKRINCIDHRVLKFVPSFLLLKLVRLHENPRYAK
jgi:hypothetical protein